MEFNNRSCNVLKIEETRQCLVFTIYSFSRFPVNDHRPPITDHRPPTTDHRHDTDHRPPTTDYRPPNTDYLSLILLLLGPGSKERGMHRWWTFAVKSFYGLPDHLIKQAVWRPVFFAEIEFFTQF